MKAVVNGVAVEGTPQEIMEYQRMQAEKVAYSKPLPNHPPYAVGTPWWGVYPPTPYTPTKTTTSPSVVDDGSILGVPKVTSGSTTARCPNSPMPCNCTGACNRPIGLSALSKTFEQWDKELGNIIKAMKR